MAKKIYELSLSDIIPPSIASDPQIQAMIAALDPELKSGSRDIREALIYCVLGTSDNLEGKVLYRRGSRNC